MTKDMLDEVVDAVLDKLDNKDNYNIKDKPLWIPTITTKPILNNNSKFNLELGSEDNNETKDETPTLKPVVTKKDKTAKTSTVVTKEAKANKVEAIKLIHDGKEHKGNENNNNNNHKPKEQKKETKPIKTKSTLKTKIIHDGKEHEGNRTQNNKRKVKWTKPKLDGR